MAQLRRNKRTGEVQEMRGGQWVTTSPGAAPAMEAPAPAFSIPTRPADPLKSQKDATGLALDNARLDEISNPKPTLPQGYRYNPSEKSAEPVPGVPQAIVNNTPGSEAVDKKFADEYVAWKTAGGFADVGKQLSQLRSVGKALKTQDNLTGPVVGNTPDFISNFVNPQAVATRESVEEVVQRSLRAVLGSQFTEKEGERLIERAYNPRQPESENRLRVARLRLQLTQAAKAKENASRYFEKNGTLRGWSGRLWSFSDFDPERNAPNPPKQSGGGIKFLGFE